MPISLELIGQVAAALFTSFLIALILTPVVRNLAVKMGAVDDPRKDKDPERRMHSDPVPRMGGLAIVLGFLLSTLIFVPMTPQLQGALLGAVIIVVLGVFDDIYDLRAKFKLVVQIVAALIAVNLAVMNLLPIPALDGGHILFLVVSTVSEKLFRKKIPMKYEAAINMVFLFLLMGLMLFVTFNDVMKLVGGGGTPS